MLLEGGFKAVDVVVTLVAPTIGGGIGSVTNFKLGDGWLGVVDAIPQSTSRLGTAVTNFVPAAFR